jgi:hypothetical protein
VARPEEDARNDARPSKNRLHRLSEKALLWFLPAAAAAGILLFAGMGTGGAGRANSPIWYIGLCAAGVGWLILLVGVGAGIASRLTRGVLPAAALISALLLVLLTLLGIWGFRG